MKTILSFLPLSLTLFLFVSCNNGIDETQPNQDANHDVIIHSVETKKNEISELYKTASFDNLSFDYEKKNVINGFFSTYTRAYTDSKECVYFESLNNENEIIAFYSDNMYGIEKSAIFDYKIEGEKLFVTACDLNKNKLFDIEVDIKTQTGVLTKVYTEDSITRAINGCNAAIYAAGIPWTVGFGMVNPLAGLIAATVFWGLEHAMCSK